MMGGKVGPSSECKSAQPRQRRSCSAGSWRSRAAAARRRRAQSRARPQRRMKRTRGRLRHPALRPRRFLPLATASPRATCRWRPASSWPSSPASPTPLSSKRCSWLGSRPRGCASPTAVEGAKQRTRGGNGFSVNSPVSNPTSCSSSRGPTTSAWRSSRRSSTGRTSTPASSAGSPRMFDGWRVRRRCAAPSSSWPRFPRSATCARPRTPVRVPRFDRPTRGCARWPGG